MGTSRGAGFRGSLEGWAAAGIRYVELRADMLDATGKNAGTPPNSVGGAFRLRNVTRYVLLRDDRAGRWQRDRTVASRPEGLGVTSSSVVRGGGSSRSRSRAFWAS